MGFGGGVGVVSAEEAANNGEENEYEVEGVAAVLNCTRFEDVGSERVQRRNHDEREHQHEYEEEYEEGGGGEQQRVRAAKTAAVSLLNRPERWHCPRVTLLLVHFV